MQEAHKTKACVYEAVKERGACLRQDAVRVAQEDLDQPLGPPAAQGDAEAAQGKQDVGEDPHFQVPAHLPAHALQLQMRQHFFGGSHKFG